MKVVIDTNVVVSAAVRDRGPETVVRWIVAQPDWRWIASTEIVAEYKAVLSRDKFKLDPALRQTSLALVDELTTLITLETTVDFPRDFTDAKFIACALAAEADYFITGDRDFSEAPALAPTIILSVSLFKKQFIDSA